MGDVTHPTSIIYTVYGSSQQFSRLNIIHKTFSSFLLHIESWHNLYQASKTNNNVSLLSPVTSLLCCSRGFFATDFIVYSSILCCGKLDNSISTLHTSQHLSVSAEAAVMHSRMKQSDPILNLRIPPGRPPVLARQKVCCGGRPGEFLSDRI